jgi:hypothetical protein
MQAIAALTVQFALQAPIEAAAADLPSVPGDAPFARADRLALDSPLDSVCRPIDCGRDRPRQRLEFRSAPGFGGALVDFGSPAPADRPARPRLGIGMRSHEVESALNGIGVEARHCLAPVVRMRTKLSSSLQLSGSLWVYLRCSVR